MDTYLTLLLDNSKNFSYKSVNFITHKEHSTFPND